MKERINRLARGIADTDIPVMKAEPPVIEGTVTAGEISKGEFVLCSENRLHLKGLVYSDQPRVKVLKEAFGGVKTRITFEVDTRNLKNGNQIRGSFCLVSNAGEKKLPYSFCVRSHASAEAIARLGTPQDFARLYMEDEALAQRMFDYADFRRAPFLRNARTRAVYEGLKASPDRRLALREFLRALRVLPKIEEITLNGQAGAADGRTAAKETAGTQPRTPQGRGARNVQRAAALRRAGMQTAAAVQPQTGKGQGAARSGAAGINAGAGTPYAQDYVSAEERYAENTYADIAKALRFAELEDPVLIEETAALCIRANCVSPSAFQIYQKAVANDSRIMRLYEYYLFALPDDFGEQLPRAIYLYFSYENSIDPGAKLPLYCNIIKTVPQDSDIYQKFEREIQEYAIDQLLAGRISDRLAVIYERMIYPDMVDARIAGVLPAILRAYRIHTDDRRMSYVVARSEELNSETVYALKNGTAYVPLFFENTVILFQDAYGRRYTQPAYTKTQVMNSQALEKRCFEIAPEHPMLHLAAVRRTAANGIQNLQQLRMVEDALTKDVLSEPFRTALNRAVLKYHSRFAGSGNMPAAAEELACVKAMNADVLSAEEQAVRTETLVRMGLFDDAWEAAVRTDGAGIARGTLERLLDHVVRSRKKENDAVLCALSMRLFEAGSKDRLLLTWLCRHYNGFSADMLKILRRGAEQRVDTADLAERLLAQMIFTRTEDGDDYVYSVYMQQKKQESALVNAWLTEKCMDWFLNEKTVSPAVFEQLERALRAEKELQRAPLIYLLTMAKYASEQKSLTKEQTELLRSIVPLLLEQKLIFSWTGRLAKFVPVPEYIADRTCIEYHGKRDEKPALFVRILPDETEFHEEEIVRVYQNIYVRQLMLFAGERADYRVYEADAEHDRPSESGQVRAAETSGTEDGIYALLNRMSALVGTGKEAELQQCMLRYVRCQAITDALFDQIEERGQSMP